MPEWWINSSGFFFIIATIAVLLQIVMLAVLIWVLLDLSKQLRRITARVEELTDKVNAITDQVKDVTNQVSKRTTGIMSVVDSNATKAFDLIEKAAPLFIGLGLVVRIAQLFKKGRR